MGQVAQTDGVEPEHVVQSVVQAGGDEQTVQESVDAGADAVHASDAVADGDQSVEDDGPDEQQNNRDNRMEIRPVAIATKRLPEKNASQSGSWVSLNLL